MKLPSLAVVLVCALIAVSAAGAAKIAASAAGPAKIAVPAAVAATPQTFALLEVNTSFVGAAGFDTMGTTPPQVGQGFVIGSDYYKWKGTKRGAKVGTLNAACTFLTAPTRPSGKTVCTAVASLPGGKITAVGLAGNDQFTIPIVGGTGTYAGAKGYVEITNNIGGKSTNKSIDRFVITG